MRLIATNKTYEERLIKSYHFIHADAGETAPAHEATTAKSTTSTSTRKPEPIRLTIKVDSVQITLPEDSAVLTAQVYPQAPRETHYNYEWKLEQGDVPPEGGVEKSQGDKVTLNHLKEGVYAFKVTVTGSDPPAFGEAHGNVTVLAGRSNEFSKACFELRVYQFDPSRKSAFAMLLL